MPKTVRYLRSISNPEAYLPPVELEDLLQKNYADKNTEPDADGIRFLQESLSLYAVEAEENNGVITFGEGVLVELAIRHAASAGLGKPNRHFLDFTDHIGNMAHPQEDTASPFEVLRACHHSLKVVQAGLDVRQLVTQICGGTPQIYSVTQAMLDDGGKRLTAPPWSAEWVAARSLLSVKFNALPPNRQQSRFGYWIRVGLLTRKP